MTNEQLDELKKILSKMTPEERKEHDLYLRGLATGEIQGPPVGYASIDKPWLKYYTKEQVLEDAPKVTCYQNLYNNNQNNLNEIALEYYGNKISYKDLFENIDKVAQAFQTMGVKKGDIVTICSITTPEIVYAFYALNKIGAISNMIDPRYPKAALSNYLKEANSKVFISLDLVYPKIKDIIDDTNVDKTIILSPTNSVPKVLKLLADFSNKLKGNKQNIPYGDKYIEWNKFVQERSNFNK